MKNIVLSGVVTALLMFSGCSDKELVVDQNNDAQESSQSIQDMGTEVVSGENSLVDSTTSNMSIEELNSKMSSVYFGFDKFDISEDMSANISAGVAIVKESGVDLNVKLEGNCDEWGSDEYNFALGLKRASSVKKALVAEGIDESHISMVSFGESNPTCTNSTKECWSKNRRVDFKFLP